MKVKRYLGETMQDAVFKVKADLGSDAIILHTRKIREGGFFGLFGKKMIEVIATVEEEPEPKVNQDLRQELSALREKIQELSKQTSENKNKYTSPTPQLLFPGKLQNYAENLVKEGVNTQLISQICQGVMDDLQVHQLHRENEVYQSLVQEITRRIPLASPIVPGSVQKTIAFVGPTGVGKTTTIAKLAAQVALQGNKQVGLITADTYRIAAVEQLKTYSDIINIPLKVIYTQEDLERAIKELYYCDLIFLDTAGRSQRNESQMGQLKELLPPELVDEIHLVIAMNTSYHDMMEAIHNFGDLFLSSLIFTKQDETNRRGVILNVLDETDYKISYIAYGQDVPEDIGQADARQLAEIMLKG